MKKLLALIGLAFVLALQACGTTGSGVLYVEPSLKRQDVGIQRVAIVPNRLPLNLQDPEKWRRYNWGVVKDEFVKRGFKVVGYETTVKLFERSGLPVEDTKSSRDKFAAIAKVMAVDAIVVPYYGTFASSKNFLIFTNNSFISVGTFQIYLAKQNDFFSRVDVSGKNQYTSNFGFATVFLGLIEPSLYTVGALGGFIYELSQTLRSSDSRWRAAFKKAIRAGLKPFFDSFALSQSKRIPQKDGALLDERDEIYTAQQEDPRAVAARNRIGFTGGLSLASIGESPAFEFEDIEFAARRGFGLGAFYERNLSAKIALRFESSYIQKGGGFPLFFPGGFNNFGFQREAEIKSAYIESVALLGVLPGKGGIRPYLMVGPTISYLLDAQIDLVDSPTPGFDITDTTNKVDFGAIICSGIRFNYIFIEARYALGFGDLGLPLAEKIRNRGLQSMVGLSLPL